MNLVSELVAAVRENISASDMVQIHGVLAGYTPYTTSALVKRFMEVVDDLAKVDKLVLTDVVERHNRVLGLAVNCFKDFVVIDGIKTIIPERSKAHLEEAVREAYQ